MAMVHYKGDIGEFDYDDTEFIIYDKGAAEARHNMIVYNDYDYSGITFKERLYYIGKETDGSKIKIPDGIFDCSEMFEGDYILKKPPVIPKGVVNCNNMFKGCKLLEKAPVIPESVENCKDMFWGCESLKEAPEIPKSVVNCISMFCDCKSLEKASVIPESVENCGYMFYGCELLKDAPIIPESVVNCNCMFGDCKSIEKAPIIPENVVDCHDMFYKCSDEVYKAGEWNMEHRGQSYYDHQGSMKSSAKDKLFAERDRSDKQESGSVDRDVTDD